MKPVIVDLNKVLHGLTLSTDSYTQSIASQALTIIFTQQHLYHKKFQSIKFSSLMLTRLILLIQEKINSSEPINSVSSSSNSSNLLMKSFTNPNNTIKQFIESDGEGDKKGWSWTANTATSILSLASIATATAKPEIEYDEENERTKYFEKILWFLDMLLKYSNMDDWRKNPNEEKKTNGILLILVDTLIRLSIKSKVYNTSNNIIRMLVENFSVSPSEIYEVGCALLSQIPSVGIHEANFISFLHLTSVITPMETSSIVNALKFLVELCPYVTRNENGDSESTPRNTFFGVASLASGYFLDNCTNFFNLCINILLLSLNSDSENEFNLNHHENEILRENNTEEMEEEIVDQTNHFLLTLNRTMKKSKKVLASNYFIILLRYLSMACEENRYYFSTTWSHGTYKIVEYVFNKVSDDNVCREIILFLNILCLENNHNHHYQMDYNEEGMDLPQTQEANFESNRASYESLSELNDPNLDPSSSLEQAPPASPKISILEESIPSHIPFHIYSNLTFYQNLVNAFSIQNFFLIANYQKIFLNEVLVDFFITLYETSFPYSEELIRYVIDSDSPFDDRLYQQKIKRVDEELNHMIKSANDYFSHPSPTSVVEEEDPSKSIPSNENKMENVKENLVMKFLYFILYDIILKIFDEMKVYYFSVHPYLSSSGDKKEPNSKLLVFYFGILSNILFKYERSFKLISNMYNMLELKIVLMKIFELNFVIVSPLKWTLDFNSLIDSFIVLLKGTEKFWDDIIHNEGDLDFINISKKLLKIKKNLNFNDIGIVLDERDLKVLKYLTEETNLSNSPKKEGSQEEDDYYLSSSLTESKIDDHMAQMGINSPAPQNNTYEHSHPMNINPTSHALDLSDDRDPDELQARIIKHCEFFTEEYEFLESFNYIVPQYDETSESPANGFAGNFYDEEDDDFDPHLVPNLSSKTNPFPASPHTNGSLNQSTELDFHHASPSPSLRHRNITPSPSLRATAPSPSIRASVSMAHFLSSSRSSVSLNTLAKSQSSVSLYNQSLSSQAASTPYSNISNHPPSPSPSPSPCIFAKTSASVPLSEFDDKRARIYVQLSKRIIVYLIGQLSWLESFVSDFYSEVDRADSSSASAQISNSSRELMARKIVFLFLLGNILGFDTLGNVIDRCDELYDILWDILNTNTLGLLSVKGIDKKCIQIITLLHLRSPKNDEFFPEKSPKDKEKLNSFKIEYIKWLMQILETRPESINGAICSAASALNHQYQSSMAFRASMSNANEKEPDNTGILSLNSSNLKKLQQKTTNSSKPYTFTRENLSVHANLFRSLSLLNNEEDDLDDEQSTVVNKSKFYLYEKFNLNIDLHNAAMFSLLEFSKDSSSLSSDEINKTILLEMWKIIFALERFLPHDLISLQPILLLLRLLLKNNSRLDLTTEASIVIFIIRSLNHNLLYIKYQACELIDFIGKVLPGFIYRAISRYEIEEPLIECFSNILSRLHHEYNVSNKLLSNSDESSTREISSSFASIQKQSSRILVSIIKAISSLVHNLNLRPYWCPSPYAYHWSVYKPYICTRDVVSPRTVNFMLIALKYADISYRGTFLSHLLSYASSCLYIYSDGIYNPNNYEDKLRIKKLSETLVSSLLPLLPLALDVLMLITKKRRRLNLPIKIFYDDDDENETNSSIGKRSKKLTKKSKLINKILLLNSTNHQKFNNENSSSIGIQKKHNFSNTNSQGNSNNNLVSSTSFNSSQTLNQNPSEQFLINLSHYDSIDEVNRSLSIELLREKVFEATLSFFCRDEDFGLKALTTYKRYAYLFQKQPLIANISMLMLDYFYNHIQFININHPINLTLPFLEKYKRNNNYQYDNNNTIDIASMSSHAQLKKGLNILSHFIESEFQLSAISMHSPLAFLSVFAAFPDNIDVRQGLIKVVLLLVKFGFFITAPSASVSPGDIGRKSLGNPSEPTSSRGQFIVQSDLVDEFGLSNLIRNGLHYGIASNFKLKTYLDDQKIESQNPSTAPSASASASSANNTNKSLTNKMLSFVGMNNAPASNTNNLSYNTELKNERKVLDIVKQSLVALLCIGSSPQRLACLLFDFDSPSLSSDSLNNLSNLMKKDKKTSSNSSLNRKFLKNSLSSKSLASNQSSNNLLTHSISNNSPYASLSLSSSVSSSNIQSLAKVRSLNKSNSLTNLNNVHFEKKPDLLSLRKDKRRSTPDLQNLSSNLFQDTSTNEFLNSTNDDDNSSQRNSDYFFGGDFEDDSLGGRLALADNAEDSTRNSFLDKPKINVTHLPTFDDIINCKEYELEKNLEIFIHSQSYNSIFLDVAELIEIYPKDLSISYFAALFLAKICQYLPYFFLNLDAKKRTFVFSCLKKARKNLMAFVKVWKPCQITCNVHSVPSVTRLQVEDLLGHPLWTQGSCSVF